MRIGGRRARRRSLTASVLTVVLFGGCGGDDNKDEVRVDTQPFVPATTTTPAPTATVPRGQVKVAGGKTRKATVADVREAVDADKIVEAERALPALNTGQRLDMRKRIANRLAREAQVALRAGNRSRVLNLLSRMKRYPATNLTRRVAADYRDAEKAAAARDNKRVTDSRNAARERRARAEAKRAEERARKAQQQQP